MSVWRPLKEQDLEKGIVVRSTRIPNATFRDCVVVGFSDIHGDVILARPYLYATETGAPLMGCETFHVYRSSMINNDPATGDPWWEVKVDSKDQPEKMLT